MAAAQYTTIETSVNGARTVTSTQIVSASSTPSLHVAGAASTSGPSCVFFPLPLPHFDSHSSSVDSSRTQQPSRASSPPWGSFVASFLYTYSYCLCAGAGSARSSARWMRCPLSQLRSARS
jgi:hypothetical protein